MAKKHVFQPFTDKKLAETEAAWMADVGKGQAFPTDVEQVLEWAKHHKDHCDGDSTAYGVFTTGTNIASGICEVVLRRQSARSAWVKFLRLRLRPALEAALFANEVDAHAEAIDIFVQACIGVVGLKVSHKATTLKVFGRTSEQLSFLTALALALQQQSKKNQAKIEGRWLVITTK